MDIQKLGIEFVKNPSLENVGNLIGAINKAVYGIDPYASEETPETVDAVVGVGDEMTPDEA